MAPCSTLRRPSARRLGASAGRAGSPATEPLGSEGISGDPPVRPPRGGGVTRSRWHRSASRWVGNVSLGGGSGSSPSAAGGRVLQPSQPQSPADRFTCACRPAPTALGREVPRAGWARFKFLVFIVCCLLVAPAVAVRPVQRQWCCSGLLDSRRVIPEQSFTHSNDFIMSSVSL